MKGPSRPRVAASFEPVGDEEWDRAVLNLLAHLGRVETAAMLGRRDANEWDNPRALRAYAVAREAIRSLWGPRAEPGIESTDAVEREGAEERAHVREGRVDSMHRLMTGGILAQAAAIVRFVARELREGRSEDVRAVTELLRYLAAIEVPDAGDLGALEHSPERLAEIAAWLRRCAVAEVSPRGELQPHAVLARIVEMSQGRPTDIDSVRPVIAEIWKKIGRAAKRS